MDSSTEASSRARSAAGSDPENRERVLVITYLFPPVGGVGVPRFVSYAKYLPEHGCDVYILTVRKPATPLYDADLAKEVPAETKVFRAFNPEVPYWLRDKLWHRIKGGGGKKEASSGPAKSGGLSSMVKGAAKSVIQRIFSPDVQVLWRPFAIRMARKIIKEHRITTVLVNLPPYSCLKIAATLKRDFPDVTQILDFRDEWIDNYLPVFDTAATEQKLRLARELERDAVTRANYVMAVTRSQLRQIRVRYPEQPESKFVYAPNGYNPDVFDLIQPRKYDPTKMVVTYFGTVYTNAAYAAVFQYLDAVEALPDEIRRNIETWFIGRVAKDAQPLMEGRKATIKQLGFMTRLGALEYLGQADFHLIAVDSATSHAGKLFDYLATGKPILGLCPLKSELAQVIDETKGGIYAEPGDRKAVTELILEAYRRSTSGAPQEPPNWDEIRTYRWPHLVAQVAKRLKLGIYRTPSR